VTLRRCTGATFQLLPDLLLPLEMVDGAFLEQATLTTCRACACLEGQRRKPGSVWTSAWVFSRISVLSLPVWWACTRLVPFSSFRGTMKLHMSSARKSLPHSLHGPSPSCNEAGVPALRTQ
jgi:hypothetical protein